MVRYWWVSQNKTFSHEVGGGYLWSPITNNRGKRVAAYDFMTEVQPGDVVFSFANTYIQAIGVAYGEAIKAGPPPLVRRETTGLRWGGRCRWTLFG